MLQWSHKWMAPRRPKKSPDPGPVEFLVVGLGNPGADYAATRHNAGWMALDRLAADAGIPVDRLKFHGITGVGSIGGHRVLLLKPTTYMNLSGEAVRDAAAFYKIPPQRVLVLFDDISLPPGRMRIRAHGTDGGHNGVKNIIYHLASDQFPRIKFGIGAKPHPDYDLKDWVTSRFSPADRQAFDQALGHVTDAVGLLLDGRTDEAMNRYNTR